jgi:RHS repeat-associated protein
VRTASSYNNRFLFTGREYLGAWVYDYRARVYHAYLGRFMSEDPKLFDAGDYNLFRYCHNDPIDLTDPMGTQDEKREPWYNHQEQAKAIDRQEAAKRMADEAYNKGMANAQRTMHGAHGGATDIGRAGYNTWFTVTRSFHNKGSYGPYVGHVKVFSYPWVDMKDVIKEGDTPVQGAVLSESREIVNKEGMYEPAKFKPLRTPATDSKGAVIDRFSAPFVSPNGYATFRQTLTLPSGVSTPGWHFTLHANGSYDIDKDTDTFR